MQFHEYANLFPMMNKDEFSGLLEDISNNGQLVPIVTWENQILDGRNRFRACSVLGVVPIIEDYTGEDPLGFVISSNLHRRHLSSSQRACLAIECVSLFRQEAKERQIEGGKNKVRQNIAEAPDERKSTQKASKMFGTNRTYVGLAMKLQDRAPDLFEQVRAGELSVFQAWKMHNHSKTLEPVKIKGKFGVIYAAPPWEYGNPFCSPRLKAEQRYPTMKLAEVKAMRADIDEVALEESVCFLWATNAFLQYGLQVLSAWGFEYHSSIVWDKHNVNEGTYTKVKHEILLIGVRGKVYPSWKPQSIIRSDRGRHSKKPVEFYEIIEKMFPEASKIEFFARNNRSGWYSWGNQNSVENATITL